MSEEEAPCRDGMDMGRDVYGDWRMYMYMARGGVGGWMCALGRRGEKGGGGGGGGGGGLGRGMGR